MPAIAMKPSEPGRQAIDQFGAAAEREAFVERARWPLGRRPIRPRLHEQRERPAEGRLIAARLAIFGGECCRRRQADERRPLLRGRFDVAQVHQLAGGEVGEVDVVERPVEFDAADRCQFEQRVFASSTLRGARSQARCGLESTQCGSSFMRRSGR